MFDDKLFVLGPICKHNHEYENTGKSLRYKNGKGCYECKKESYKNYIKMHRTEKLEYDKEWSKSETGKGYHKKWNKTHKEKVKESRKKYRESHKEEIKELKKDWNEKNKEHVQNYALKYLYGITIEQKNKCW